MYEFLSRENSDLIVCTVERLFTPIQFLLILFFKGTSTVFYLLMKTYCVAHSQEKPQGKKAETTYLNTKACSQLLLKIPDMNWMFPHISFQTLFKN